MLAVDPRRFGVYANKHYTKAKNEEAYAHVFIIHYPDEGAPGGAARQDQPLPRQACGARRRLGPALRLGAPQLVRAPKAVEPRDDWSFRRTNYFEPVGAECRAVRQRAGLIDITSFSKFRVSGPGAEAALDRVLANRLPKAAGRIKLAHALTENGGVRSEFTVLREGPESFYLVSSGAAERYDHDFMLRHVSGDGGTIENITTAHGVLVLAGPRSRDILAAGDRRRPLQRGIPLAHGAAHFHRHRADHCDAGQLRGRAGLGAAPTPSSIRTASSTPWYRPGSNTGSPCAACGRWIRSGSKNPTACGGRI